MIMPFSQTSDKHTKKYWTTHFQNFLKPLIETCGQLVARRSKPLHGDILRQIITNLATSPIVVADLTDLNPNVFWELGVRQSFLHGTITIAEVETELPFDVSTKGTLFYHDSHIGNEEFCTNFKKSITHCLDNPNSPDSSVLETLSGRGTLYEIFHRAEILRRIDALIDECNYNNSLLSEVITQIKRNKKEPQNWIYETSRFMSSGAELLLTDRYLNEQKSFYKIVSKCLSSVDALNDMLREWSTSRDTTETWFENCADMYKKRFKKHKKILIDAQKKLLERVSETVF